MQHGLGSIELLQRVVRVGQTHPRSAAHHHLLSGKCLMTGKLAGAGALRRLGLFKQALRHLVHLWCCESTAASDI